MKKLLASALLVLILGFSRQAHADITTGLVGYWNFDEGSGSSAMDSSGSGNAATLVSPASWTTGKIGSGALSLDGSTAYAKANDSASLRPSNVTVSVWAYFNPATKGYFAVKDKGLGTSYQLDNGISNSGYIEFCAYVGSAYSCAKTANSSYANAWTHIVGIYDGTNRYLYINGALKDTVAGGAMDYASPAQLFIGGYNILGNSISGSLDDVRIYSRALSASDVSELYAYTGSSGGGANPPPADTTAPTMPLNLSATAISSSGINLAWTASTDATGVTGYKIYRNGAQVTTVAANSYSDSGLTASTNYSYAVSAYDAAGNTSAQSTSANATTQAVSADTTPPVISSVSSGPLTSSSASITWSTNESSDSQVEYGLTTSYGNSTSLNSSPVISHSATLSPLSASTLYHYRTKSKDAAGNLATGADNTFTTTASSGGGVGSGTNFYVAQTSAGSADASSCANAQSAAWFNTSSNWAASGSGKVIPGSTVHLCGTISTGLVAQASGSSGNPITIIFEPNAKISIQPWVTPTAITVSNRDWITIDGGTNGLIEALDNGSSAAQDGTGPSFGHQVDATGIDGETVTHLTIQNLKVDNMYQRKFNSSTDGTRVGQGLVLSGSNILVQNNTLTDGDTMIAAIWGPGTGVYHDLTITGNTIGRANHGIGIGSYQDGNSYFDNVTISNNRINDLDVWNGNSALHLDGIIIYDESHDNSGGISNLNIYNNYIGPNIGTINTAAIFIIAYTASEAPSTKIYNNLFTAGPGYSWTNGFIAASGKIYNNTMIGQTSGIKIGSVQAQPPGDIRNNLFYNSSSAGCTTITTQATAPVTSDNNVYACAGQLQNVVVDSGGAYLFYYGMPAWRTATGYDANTLVVTDPKFVDAANGDYRLLSSSPALNVGANLSSYFTVDKNGNARPSSGAWDVGAYQYGSGSGGGSTPPPADTTAPSVSITSPSSGTISGSVSLAASASDNVGVVGVQFKLDGANLGSELTVAPYSGSWNTAGVSNGSHTLTAVARDAAGNTKTSAGVTVTVSNSVTPPADTSAPSTPAGLTPSSVTQTGVTLSWLAAVDNVGVTGYKVFRNGTQIASPTTNSYAVTGLTANTTYTFTVSAYDAAGNTSSLSNPLSVTTSAIPVTTFTLSTTKSGSGTGIISGNGLNCGSTCSVSITSGTSVTLTATPSADSTFDGWSGACSNTSGTCVATVTAAKSVAAIFTLIPVSNPVTPPASGGGGGSSGGGSSGGGSVVSSPTGIFTPTVSVVGTIPGITSSPSKGTGLPGIILTKNLYVGITDPEVMTLQKYLALEGYLTASPTGYFGSMTEAAVSRYQAAHNISQTGTVGPLTRASLAGGSSAVTTAPTTSTSIPAFTRSMTIGATGSDVKYLQIFLNKHGFQVSLSGAGSPNNETTLFGPATQRALAKFQLAKGISPAVGYFGPLTMKAVNGLR